MPAGYKPLYRLGDLPGEADMDLTNPRNFFYKNHFFNLGNVTNLVTTTEGGWESTDIGAGGLNNTGLVAAVTHHPGISFVQTSATIDTGFTISPHDRASALLPLPALNTIPGWQFWWVLQMPSAANIAFRAGLQANGGAALNTITPAEFIGIVVDTAIDTTLKGELRNAGAQTLTPALLAAIDTAFYAVRAFAPSAGQVTFELYDANYVRLTSQTISTNFPTTTLSPAFSFVTRTAANKNANLDLFQIYIPIG